MPQPTFRVDRFHTFVVQNICQKVVRIFNYPVVPGGERDLMKIPGISESDIRHSLTCGDVWVKISASEIAILQSNVDLVQFSESFGDFITAAGVTVGAYTADASAQYSRYVDEELVGIIDGVNTTFAAENGPWIQNNFYRIVVYLNGVRQKLVDDYNVLESGGAGTGYDTIEFVEAPESLDVVTADYYVTNV